MLTVHVLGAVEVRRDGEALELGGPQQRAVIAHLALAPGRVVSVERLIDRLWGEEPPRTPLGTLQSYVSRLRRAVEPSRGAGTAPQVLVSEAPGYVLQVAAEHVDVHQFRGLVADGRAAAAAGGHVQALLHFDAAIALWRGPALAGVGPEDRVRAIVAELDEEREAAVEDRFATLLALGRHGEAVARLQTAVDEQPLRERLWALLALALYRSSRQADALRALSSARTVLREELGLDPGPELRELERRILDQDPALTLTPSTPVATATVDAEPPPPPLSAELVGRSEEWKALVAALDAAGRGRPSLVLVEGEPGIGKSTLCDAFQAHASAVGWSTAVGRCLEPGLAPSLWPCIEVVRSMVGDGAADGGAAANPLRRLVSAGRESGVSLSAVETADHFVGLLDELAGTPWLIVLDDLHWADPATLAVVRLVLERLRSRRVLVVGAHRPPEGVRGSLLGEALGDLRRSVPTTTMSMSPLDTECVARLMKITTGVTPSDELAGRIRDRAGGNPLFVTELARLLGERGVADERTVPHAVRDVVRGRLAQLPERATAELEVAAVLGERFDLRTAMAASERDPDACLDALDAAIVTRILVPDGDGYRFAHALVRDAVIAEVSSLRLARLHQRAADAIVATRGDGPNEAEPIAHHRLAAAAFTDPVLAARAAVRAADVARWRGALDACDALAEQALAVLANVPRTADTTDLEVEALEAMISAAYRRADEESMARVTARVGEHAARSGSDAAAALSMFVTWGDIDETDDLSEIARAVEPIAALAARTTDSYAIVTLRFMLAAYDLLLGNIDAAAQHAAVAIEASGTSSPDEPPEHVPLVLRPVIAGVAAAVQGDAVQAREHSQRRARAWFAKRGEVDPSASVALAFNRVMIEALLGSPQAVLDELAAASRSDDRFVMQELAFCEALEGWARVRCGDAEGLEQATRAIAVLDASNERVLRSCLRTFLADACLAVHDRRALELLERARAEAESRGERWWLAETLRLLAEADTRFGDGTRAVELLDEAESLATRQGAGVVLPRIAASRAALS